MGPTAQSLSILSLKWGQESLISHPGSKRLLPSGPLSLALSQASPLPLQESLIFAAIGKAGSAHTQVLHQPQVLHLVPDQHLIKAAWRKGNRVISGFAQTDGPWSLPRGSAPQAHGWEGPTRLFGIIGLDAADISGLLRLQDLHQLQEAHLELGGHLVSQGEWEVGWSWAEAPDPSLAQPLPEAKQQQIPQLPPALPQPFLPPPFLTTEEGTDEAHLHPQAHHLAWLGTSVQGPHWSLKILLSSRHNHNPTFFFGNHSFSKISGPHS